MNETETFVRTIVNGNLPCGLHNHVIRVSHIFLSKFKIDFYLTNYRESVQYTIYVLLYMVNCFRCSS